MPSATSLMLVPDCEFVIMRAPCWSLCVTTHRVVTHLPYEAGTFGPFRQNLCSAGAILATRTTMPHWRGGSRRPQRALPTPRRYFCRRFAPRIRLFGLKRLRSEAAAADLVQDVLMLVLQKLRAGAVREPERIASFVLGTARQLVIDTRRNSRPPRAAARYFHPRSRTGWCAGPGRARHRSPATLFAGPARA